MSALHGGDLSDWLKCGLAVLFLTSLSVAFVLILYFVVTGRT